MGHQVVYCDQCGKMLREEDFLRGKALTVEHRSYCTDCRPPTTAPAPLPTSTPRPLKTLSSTRIPVSALEGPRPGRAARPPAWFNKTVILGAIAIVLTLGTAIIALLSSGKSGEGNREISVSISAPHAPPPAPAPLDPRAVASPTPVPAPPVEELARKAYQKALKIEQSDRENLAAVYQAFDVVLQKFATSPVAQDARGKLKALQARLDEEIGKVTVQAEVRISAEEFKTALDLWQMARPRFAIAYWTDAVDAKVKEVNDMVGSRYPVLRARAADLKRVNAMSEVAKVRDRILKWGMPNFVEDFEKTLASVAPERPSPPTTKEADAYRAGWRKAMGLAAGRDYEAAAQALEKASAGLKESPVKTEASADAEILKLVAQAGTEGRALLSKLPRGQKLALSYTDESGAMGSGEATLLSGDGERLEFKLAEEPIVVLAGEIGGATLADLYLNRPARKPEDAKAAAFLCLIEGDAEAAKRIWAQALSDRYLALAAEVAQARKSPESKEGEARKRCADAEREYFVPARTLEAIKSYQSLLADFGGTMFVRRNRAAIAARTDGAREYVLTPAELDASENFRLLRFNNVECWMSSREFEGPLKDSYVEVTFSARADLDYHLWVQVGGCCQEVMTFSVQGTDLRAPNPRKLGEILAVPIGGDAVGAVRMPMSSLKRKHADHLGPKQPDKWEWVKIPLQKYPTAGVKSVRLLSAHKGFSVASVVITGKSGPPREADLKEEEKARTEIPGYASYRRLSETGGILREWWEGIPGTQVSDLKGNQAFPDKPTGIKIEPSFKAPLDWADNYGTRMRGWIHPPVTGNYVFSITTDDQGELWLSADDRPDSKLLKKIAGVPEWAGPNEWSKFASQQSEPIPLVAGKRYYIEAFQKEGTGGDHLIVKWKLPDGREENPIPGCRLSPWRKK